MQNVSGGIERLLRETTEIEFKGVRAKLPTSTKAKSSTGIES